MTTSPRAMLLGFPSLSVSSRYLTLGLTERCFVEVCFTGTMRTEGRVS